MILNLALGRYACHSVSAHCSSVSLRWGLWLRIWTGEKVLYQTVCLLYQVLFLGIVFFISWLSSLQSRSILRSLAIINWGIKGQSSLHLIGHSLEADSLNYSKWPGGRGLCKSVRYDEVLFSPGICSGLWLHLKHQPLRCPIPDVVRSHVILKS
jgi:hypothetical protein